MKRTIKMLTRIASIAMTAASVLVICAVLCTIDIDRVTWTPFLALFAAEAWLAYVFMKFEKGGDE